MNDHIATGQRLDLAEAAVEGDDALLLLEKALIPLRQTVVCLDGMRELMEGAGAEANWCSDLAAARNSIARIRDAVRLRAEGRDA